MKLTLRVFTQSEPIADLRFIPVLETCEPKTATYNFNISINLHLKSYSILCVQLSTQSLKRTLESTKVHIKLEY